MTKLLYNIFPRQIALPYRITVDREKFYKMINLINGKKRIFSSIYNYTGNFEYDRIALKVDKVFFDFDGPESLPYALTLIEECISKGYQFIPFFSGAGFHVYVFTNSDKLINPKVALTKFQNQFKGMDRSSIGDVARVATIPNTYNVKRGKFCIPLTIEDMKAGYDHMKDLAECQRFDARVYGDTPVNLTSYDGEYEEEPTIFDEPRIDTRKITELPPCINDILSYTKKGFRGRYLLIVYLKDAGYTKTQIEDVIKEFCTDKEAKHCIDEEKQVNYLYWKNIMFPSCEQIKSEGRCPEKAFCNFTRMYDRTHIVKIYK